MQQGLQRSEVAEALERVLNREGIPEPEPEANPILEWLSDWFGGWDIQLDALRWILIVCLCILLGRLLWKYRKGRPTDSGSPQVASQQRAARVSALREQARQAEAAGDGRAALRLYFFALVVGLGAHGDLHYRPAWTLREILERGKPKPELRPRLERVLVAVEPRSFGAVPTQAQDVAQVRELCLELLGPDVAEVGG